MSLPGFKDEGRPTGEAHYFVSRGGSGPAVLLLHGFPETHLPALLVIGEDETQLADASDIWRTWAEDLTARQVPGSRFILEEAPGELSEILAGFPRRAIGL